MRPPLRLHSYQREAIKCIACAAGIPLIGPLLEARTTIPASPSTTPRFRTVRLASKLARALQQKTP